MLETRHALEGIAAYYAALRSTDEDRVRIRELHQAMNGLSSRATSTLNLTPSSSIKLRSPKPPTT
ncbi:FCD domain-containing protein [Escherichia coli]